MKTRPVLLVMLAVIAACSISTAQAGLFRAYVAQSGNDSNPCTLQQPCRLLPAALAAINNGGEIWMLDSANFNAGPVNINKSVTILAVPGALGSIVASGGDAIDIATANVEVTLRNLVVLNFTAGAHGINFSQGAHLLVEECEVYGLPQDGIHVTATAGVTIKNTTIHNVGGSGISVANASAAIERVTLFAMNTGLAMASGAFATFDSGLVQNATTGISVAESGGSGSRLTIDRSVIRSTGTAVRLSSAAGPDIVRVTIARTTIANNTTGIDVQGGNAFATLDSDVAPQHRLDQHQWRNRVHSW